MLLRSFITPTGPSPLTIGLTFPSTPSNFSWIHISFVKDNNPKTTSISSKKESLHKIYEGELTTRIGDYTHGITLAKENLT